MASWVQTEKRSVRSVQATTESPPTTDTGCGLGAVGGFVVYAEADSGQTFGGTGSLLGYLYDDTVGAWARAPELDLDFTSEMNGFRRVAWAGFMVSNPRGRVAHFASGVGVTGGGLTLYYACAEVQGNPV